MDDAHGNIFHAYRGASASEDGYARQLEDNFTRALAITLHRIHESPARAVMLAALGFPESEWDEPYVCQLQIVRPGAGWPALSNRKLLVVHAGPRLSIQGTAVVDGGSRVDAVVRTANWAVAIESKIGDTVEAAQLARHQAALGIAPDIPADITWSGLARAARAAAGSAQRYPVAAFVLSQFQEYLQMNGFGGFTNEHFQYFAQNPELRDQVVKDGVRRALHEVAQEIVLRTGTTWRAHVMNIARGAGSAGVVIEPGERARAPHLTVEIETVGVSIFANIELKEPYWTFRRAMHADPHGLIEIIRNLGSQVIQQHDDLPWRLVIKRRVPTSRVRQYHYWTATDIALGVMASWKDEAIRSFVDAVTSQPQGEAVPETLLIRSYPAWLVLRIEDLAERLAADVREVEPFFTWVGEPYLNTL